MRPNGFSRFENEELSLSAGVLRRTADAHPVIPEMIIILPPRNVSFKKPRRVVINVKRMKSSFSSRGDHEFFPIRVQDMDYSNPK